MLNLSHCLMEIKLLTLWNQDILHLFNIYKCHLIPQKLFNSRVDHHITQTTTDSECDLRNNSCKIK